MGGVLILGGSNCQKNAFAAAKRMGLRTVLADYYPNPPAAGLADIHERVSTFDVPGCIALARRHRVEGVMTMGTDQPVYTAARVAEALGLPSQITVETAYAVTNKRAMKERFALHGIPTVRYAYLSRGEDAGKLEGLHPPLVLKPLDSQGQRGVFLVHSREECLALLEETLSFSREDTALVEEYYPSDEITVSAWVQEGEAHVLAVTDRQGYGDPRHIGVCVGHRFPSVHMGRYGEVEELTRRCARAFGVENGPFYLQMLVGERGVVLNELACRIGGAFEDVFLPYLTGFDILEAQLRCAMGGKADVSPLEGYSPPGCPRQASVQLMFCRPGAVCSVTPLRELFGLPFVLDAGYNYGVGDRLPAMENATARFGHCVLVDGGEGNLEDKLEQFYRLFAVRDAQGNNLVIPRDLAGRVKLFAEGRA